MYVYAIYQSQLGNIFFLDKIGVIETFLEYIGRFLK